MALRLPPSAVAFANPLTQSGSCLVHATHKRPRLACSGPNSHGYPVASARQLCSVESHKARVQRRASHTPNHTPEPYPEPYLRFIPLIPTSRHGHVKKTHTQMSKSHCSASHEQRRKRAHNVARTLEQAAPQASPPCGGRGGQGPPPRWMDPYHWGGGGAGDDGRREHIYIYIYIYFL